MNPILDRGYHSFPGVQMGFPKGRGTSIDIRYDQSATLAFVQLVTIYFTHRIMSSVWMGGTASFFANGAGGAGIRSQHQPYG